jgi:hypothetical protein
MNHHYAIEDGIILVACVIVFVMFWPVLLAAWFWNRL